MIPKNNIASMGAFLLLEHFETPHTNEERSSFPELGKNGTVFRVIPLSSFGGKYVWLQVLVKATRKNHFLND